MTGLWREVIDRAGGRCECEGACGRKHKDDPAGRCTRENAEAALLHAVPREPVTTRAAVSLPASALHALCGPCHDTTARKHAAALAEALRARADANSLF
jgi:hypothetical protein